MDADHRPHVESNNVRFTAHLQTTARTEVGFHARGAVLTTMKVGPDGLVSQCGSSLTFCEEVDDSDEIVGTVELVTEILDGVVREMDWGTFETAVCVLHEAMGEETDLNIRASVRGALMKALLTRFACYGWSDDRTVFNKLWIDDSEEGFLTIQVLQCLSQSSSDTPDVVQLALGLIESIRKGIDGTVLGTAICVASEALESGACQGNSRHHLEIVLGRALVIDYIQGGSIQSLEQGYRMFRDADVPHGANDPWAYIRAVSLENIGWTKCVEQGMNDVLIEGKEWQDLAKEEDRQGSRQYNLGTELLGGGEFEEALPEALGLRPSPHPDRSVLLNNLANALSTRFEQKGSFDDLEECIMLFKEVLGLIPPPHPHHSTVLFNLAQAKYNIYLHSHDGKDLDSALNLSKASAEYSTASLLIRLDSAKQWALWSRQNHRASTLDAYSYIITLLPLLSSLDLTLLQRQNVLVHTRYISSDAAQWAISVDALQTAVVFLSTSRSVFWSQALQLRSPLDRLDSVNQSLAQDLRSVSQRLEHAANQTSATEPISHRHPQPNQSETLYALSQQRERLLAKAREIDGFQDFLLPPSFDSLSAAARNGPVVLLNASKYSSDAVIMRPGGQLQHVSLGVELAMLQTLSSASQQLAQQQFIRSEIVEEITEHLIRSSSSDTRLQGRIKRRPGTETLDDDFRYLLGCLWTLVVKPVVDCLGLSKTEAPCRLWWCATGVFSFLPIHAAGLYSQTDGAEDALFQYAILSYIYTPQDLISPPPALTSDFKMVAVIEPTSGSGYNALPMTKVELEKIQTRIPARDNLIEHVGKRTDPIKLDDVLSSLKKCSFAHFGCHGIQHSTNPLASALVLSGGRLTMEKVIQKCQASNGSLAYLSACQTAKSDEERPDEALTLAATMLFAGFRGVVGTMWSISDNDAPVVADTFYAHMFRNGTEHPPDVTEAAYALHLAVQKIRDSGAMFWNWVPYVHYGV
ncbi:hypothetical protein FA15DRAFT_661499 [Coprinopsis marcescibilis]|uniref:CHAT domain-containing protein n=1 Tax=Coprinopsis marcescibilis TaxID=230819 RepID=A0A5C3KBS7_COPMA|nr:hypothetical protein FA15DRAFT_661499 [Coprinopsis marcescibilis]